MSSLIKQAPYSKDNAILIWEVERGKGGFLSCNLIPPTTDSNMSTQNRQVLSLGTSDLRCQKYETEVPIHAEQLLLPLPIAPYYASKH